jgi:predicted transcriptional regulator
MGGNIKEGITKIKNKKVHDPKVPTIIVTKELVEQGKSIKEISKERECTQETIISHIEQIIIKYPETIITHIRPDQKNINAVKKANSKIKDGEIGRLTKIKIALEKEGFNMTWIDIRIAKLFI